MDEKKIETNIGGDVKGSGLNIASQNSQTTINYTEAITNSPELVKLTTELLDLIKANLNPETAAVVSGMVNEAAVEAQKADSKDRSKIQGIINVVSPIVQAIPALVDTFSSWVTSLTS